MRILVDPDLLLEVALNRSGFKRKSEDLWHHLEKGQFQGFISGFGLANISASVSEISNYQASEEFIQTIKCIMKVCPSKPDIIDNARKLPFDDFKAAVDVAQAGLYHLSAIITKNPSKYDGAKIPVCTVEDLYKLPNSSDIDRAVGKSGNYKSHLKPQIKIFAPDKKEKNYKAKSISKITYVPRTTVTNCINILKLIRPNIKRKELIELAKDKIPNIKNDSSVINAIIDLSNFFPIKYDKQEKIIIVTNEDILSSNDHQIAQYLSKKLKDHIVIKKMRELGKEYIHKDDFYQILKEESDVAPENCKDYKAKMLPWFFFAGLLEKVENFNYLFTLPTPTKEGRQKGKPSECVFGKQDCDNSQPIFPLFQESLFSEDLSSKT